MLFFYLFHARSQVSQLWEQLMQRQDNHFWYMAYLGFSQKLDCEIRFYVQVVYWGDNPRKVGKWGKEGKESGPGFFIHRLTLWTARIPSGSGHLVDSEKYALKFYGERRGRIRAFIRQFPFFICRLLFTRGHLWLTP